MQFSIVLAAMPSIAMMLMSGAAAAATWDLARWDRDVWNGLGGASQPTEYVAPRYYEGRTPSGAAVVGTVTGGTGAEKFNAVSWSSGAGTQVTPPSVAQSYQLTHGLLNADVKDLPVGGSITIRLTFSQTFPAGTVYMKYGPRPGNPASEWYVFPNAVINGNTIYLTLTDGGLGDGDLTANGQIADPGGPAIPVGNNGNGGNGGNGAGGNGGGGTAVGEWRLVAIPGQLPFKKDAPATTQVLMDRLFLSVSPDTGAPINYFTPGSEGFVMHGNSIRSFFDLNGTTVQNVTVGDLPACSAIALRQGPGTTQTVTQPSFMLSSSTPAVDVPRGWSLVTFLGPYIHPSIEAIISVGDGKEARYWSKDGTGTLKAASLANLPAFAFFAQPVRGWGCGLREGL